MSGRLISRGPKGANRSPREATAATDARTPPRATCSSCDKPLGSTGPVCRDCGGTSARREQTPLNVSLLRLLGRVGP